MSIKRHLEGISQNLASYLVLAVMGAVGLAVWAAIEDLSPLGVALVFLAGIWFILEILTRGRDLWQRFQMPHSPEAWGKTLSQWLYAHQYSVQDWPAAEFFFRFNAVSTGRDDNKQDSGVTVLAPKDRPEYILILSSLSLTSSQKLLESFTVAQRAAIVNKVNLEVLKTGVMVPEFSNSVIVLQDVLPWADGLTPFEFLQRVLLLRRALAITQLAFVEAMRSVIPPEPDARDSDGRQP